MQSLVPLNHESQVFLNPCLAPLRYVFRMAMETMGDRIRWIRNHNLKLTQTEFGELFGLTKGTISQWESNQIQPPVTAIIKLATIADISTDFILLGEASPAAQEITLFRQLRAAIAAETHWNGLDRRSPIQNPYSSTERRKSDPTGR